MPLHAPITKLLAVRPWKPLHRRLLIRDLLSRSRQPEQDHRVHLTAAIDWLCRAQDARENAPDAGGVSAGWSFSDGWLPSYPETSGYIIETLLRAAEVLERAELRDRAGRIVDWELSIQNKNGSFPGHFGAADTPPVIFNTGQIMHGLMEGATTLNRPECLEAAVRAGRWMTSMQDDDGCWRKNVFNGIPHTYNTRAAWALLRTGLASGEEVLIDAAVRNLEWARHEQADCGWYFCNNFTLANAPFTHTIAYAAEGLLEGGLLAQREDFIDAGRRAALPLAERLTSKGFLSGEFGEGWDTRARYCCLTGTAQMSMIWSRLHQLDGTPDLADAARRANSYLKRNQVISGLQDPVDGAIPGSAPIWGRYLRFTFPNWAAKFFADALLREMP